MFLTFKSIIKKITSLFIFSLFLVLFIGYKPALAEKLPIGYEGIKFGMSEVDVASRGFNKGDDVHHFSYGEHFETQPNVYVKKSDEFNVEIYLFKKHVYKIFIIYNKKNRDNKRAYAGMVEKNVKLFGNPSQTYEENVFGLTLTHNLWLDSKSIMDLRLGAGFIFKVLIDKKVKKEKELQQKMERGI